MALFTDRADAGRRLAKQLEHLAGRQVVVAALPRGGVPVGFEVARELNAPLDVIVIRKLGVPFQPELAMGAIGEGGVRILNDSVLAMAKITRSELAEVEQRERRELERRVRMFRGDRPPEPLAGRTVVLVDDGVATGATARAACRVARAHGAAHVVMAVPVGAVDAIEELHGQADEVVCLATPEFFFGVGQWYANFEQTSDRQVAELLAKAAASQHAADEGSGSSADPPGVEEVQIPVGDVVLEGTLSVPRGANGVVVFAHGSGSGRHSPRNRFVATALNRRRLGTLLFDLLTPDEELDRANVFDVELLGGRLLEVTRWLSERAGWIGYFGASTGAAAALWAASEPGASIAAVVSRGGRPDLAGPRLSQVQAPTLLIVGGRDEVVLELNRLAAAQLAGPCEIAVVPGATHLFEEPGALPAVADLAGDWFVRHAPQ
jgi:putative phosphoribosyl transferase